MAFNDKIKSVCFVIPSIFRFALSPNSVTVTNSVLIIPELAQPHNQPLTIFAGIYIVSDYVNLNFASRKCRIGRIIPKYL